MTLTEFITYAQIPQNVHNTNVWYSTTSPYTILGITIPTTTFTGQDITSYLNQVEQISLPGQISGTDVELTLNVNTRQIYYTSNGNFYFYTVTPNLTGNLTALTGSGQVILSPAIDSNVFNESPYNVLHGSIEQTRKSEHIMFSDRYTVGTLALPNYTGPTNIDALLSGSASKADVQDSLYSNTGWINARYTGTKTNSVDYVTEPAAAGKVFKASEYPVSYSISQIQYEQSSSQVIYSDYFYTGHGDIPGFSIDPLAPLTVSGSNYNQYSTVIFVKGIGWADPTLYLPRVGDSVAYANSSIASDLQHPFEVMLVQSVTLYSTSPHKVYSIQVVRYYKGTPNNPPSSPGDNDALFRINPTKIYKLQGNKIIGVNAGQLLVQGTGNVLTLDKYGYVVTST